MNSIEDAKKYLRINFEKGVKCPCCGQFVKLYHRKINSGMAVELITLYKLSKVNENSFNEYFHHSKFATVSGGEISKLEYWGLVYQKAKTTEDTKAKTSGFWKITDKGIDFVRNKIEVPEQVSIFDARLYGFSEKMTNIVKSLGSKFDYNELMNA